MKKIIFYDVETTGLPNWKIPSDDKTQPHIVGISAFQCDIKTEEIAQHVNLIIKPNGWKIPDEVTAIHGITTEHALAVGVSEESAVSILLDLCRNGLRVAHNRTFDQRIIRIALKRYFDEIMIEKWGRKDDHECTMLAAKPVMKMLPKSRFGFKNPKLEEAYKYFTGKELKNAHSAMPDAKACMKIYFAMQKKKRQ